MDLKRICALAGVVAALAGGCTDQPSPLASPNTDPAPFLDIIDGHSDPATHPQFFFGAPIRPLHLQPPTTGFNATLRPVVEIYQCTIRADGHGCGALGSLASRLTMDDPSAIDRIYVLPQLKQYAVIWRTGRVADLDPTKFYRIQVKVGSAVLGEADVDIVRTARELLNVRRDDFVGTFDNFILPITFWIGNGALCGGAASCSATTVKFGANTPATTLELQTPTEDFKLDFTAATSASVNGVPVSEVTFSLESCPDLAVDLPTFGDCLRVKTFFSGPSGELSFSAPALVSMCVLEPGLAVGQEELISLHQQDGNVIRALPHAGPNCGVISARTPASHGIWGTIRDIARRLLVPQPAFASSRTAMFNLGGGGNTGLLGAVCTPPTPSARGMLLVECPPAVAPQMSAAAVAATPRTVSDFQFALPSQINFENGPDLGDPAPGAVVAAKVKVTDALGGPVADATVRFHHVPPAGGNGGVASPSPRCTTSAADDLICTTDASGIIEVQWTVSGTEGRNLLSARGRGMGIHAAQDGTGPFDSCIPVVLPSGRVDCLGTAAVVLNLNRGAISFFADAVTPMGSLQFIQQPTNTVTGQAIAPALVIQVRNPSGQLITGSVGVTVGNATGNPEGCYIPQREGLALDGIATFSNVVVNGTCTGARVAATAGGGAGGSFAFPVIVSTPFDIIAGGMHLTIDPSSTTLAIGGPNISYVATISNGTGVAQSNVGVQAWIDQGSTTRAAGGTATSCAALGVVPTGTCTFSFSYLASNSTGGSGTLVPGSATARFELKQGETIVETLTFPVTLTSP